MTDVSRRQFIRTASIGAAAAGVLAASGTALLNAADADASPLSTSSRATDAVPVSNATDIFAHVSDASTGQITVFHGTQAFTVVDPALARALARVTA